MSLQNNQYPNVLKLKKIEHEMASNIKEYKALQEKLKARTRYWIAKGSDKYDDNESIFKLEEAGIAMATTPVFTWPITVPIAEAIPYVPFLKSGGPYGVNTTEAKTELEAIRLEMVKKINTLSNLVSQAEPILASIVSKGEMNQDIVRFKQKDLHKLNNNLQQESQKINNMMQELSDADANNDIQSKQQGSYMIQGLFISILAIIVVGLTVNAMVNPQGNSIETAVLVIAIALVLYFLYNKYV